MTWILLIASLIISNSCGVMDDVSQRLVIDTFSSNFTVSGCIPQGWYSSQQNVRMFSVVKDSGNCYVKIKSQGGNTSIGIRTNFDVLAYPLLSWKWRVHKLPKGAVESVRKRSDSAAGVYVIFHGALKLNRIIKYVWSTSLQKGVVTESPFNPNVKIVVLHSGNEVDLIGLWVNEIVNVENDYKRLFGSKPPSIDAVAILSDSDNTKSVAEADYDDFLISAIK